MTKIIHCPGCGRKHIVDGIVRGCFININCNCGISMNISRVRTKDLDIESVSIFSNFIIRGEKQ